MANGLGPWWFPAAVRVLLTRLSAAFFKEAAWQRHDQGYARGYPARNECDRLFLAAMLRDASRATTAARMLICTALALFFWAMVRVFGVFSWRR